MKYQLFALSLGFGGVILATRDGGATWFEPAHPRLFHWLRAAAFAPQGRALVVGERGVILRSDDAGETWEQAAGRRPASP